MTDKGRVVWTEGMFLRPQHFQQQTRYFENYVESRVRSISDFSWGLTQFEFDQELMLQGKLSTANAAGILPDGTPLPYLSGMHLRPSLKLAVTSRIRWFS